MRGYRHREVEELRLRERRENSREKEREDRKAEVLKAIE